MELVVTKGGGDTGVGGVQAHWTQNYTFDRWGNRTNVNVNPNSVTANNQAVPTDGLANLSYDQATNRINTAGYEYDKAGNLIKGQAADGSWQWFEYDCANRLVNVYADNNGVRGNNLQGSGFTSSNRRLVTNEAGTLTWYVWGGDSVMAEYTSTGWASPMSWKKSYVYAGGSLLLTSSNNGSGGETNEFQHPDRLGTKLVTNNQANTSFEQSTLPFGASLDAETSGATNRRFTTYNRSSVTGIDYAVNRSYSSAQGRFTSVDPIGMQATSLDNPQTLNLYNYCGNDPINRTDPDGQSWLSKLWKAIKFIVKIIIAVVVSILAVVSFMHGDVYGGLQFLQKALDAWGDVFHNDLLHKMARMLSIALGGYDYLKGAFSQREGKRVSFFALVGAIAGLLKDRKKNNGGPCKNLPLASSIDFRNKVEKHISGIGSPNNTIFRDRSRPNDKVNYNTFVLPKVMATLGNPNFVSQGSKDNRYEYYKNFGDDVGRTEKGGNWTKQVLVIIDIKTTADGSKYCEIFNAFPKYPLEYP